MARYGVKQGGEQPSTKRRRRFGSWIGTTRLLSAIQRTGRRSGRLSGTLGSSRPSYRRSGRRIVARQGRSCRRNGAPTGRARAPKSLTIVGKHPPLEVVSLRCSQQAEDGPFLVSFLVAAPPNLVVVLRHHGRLFLCGGYHRVYRLLQAGFSQVPCVVQDAPGLGQIARYGSFLFQEPVLMAPRPPLFTDFADPELGSMAPLHATHAARHT
jgi:hypothetical protein